MEVQSVLVSNDSLARRVIKRYSNRKLYDTHGSRYVTLLQIADMVRSGEEVQIIDNATKEDKTEVTMALIISEELKERPRTIPIGTLKALIQNRGERILADVAHTDGASSKLTAKETPLKTAQSNQAQPNLNLEQQRQKALEPSTSLYAIEIQTLRSQVRSLNERLAEVERRLSSPA